MTTVPPNDERLPLSVAPRPLERHWHEYRETAMPQDSSPADLRASRVAFYSAAAALLAELAQTNGSLDTIEAMSAELDEFLFDMATEAQS